MYFPSVLAKQQVTVAVSAVVKAMAPDVVHIRYDFGEDWSGDQAIFFRILLSDDAADRRLDSVASRVVSGLDQYLDYDGMGLRPYYNFRSVSEQAALREETWA